MCKRLINDSGQCLSGHLCVTSTCQRAGQGRGPAGCIGFGICGGEIGFAEKVRSHRQSKEEIKAVLYRIANK